MGVPRQGLANLGSLARVGGLMQFTATDELKRIKFLT